MPKIVDHDARREDIAETVARLIAEQGLDSVTIQAIARACGYSAGMVLHYFENKESLLLSALDWCEARHQARIAQMVEGRRGLDALLQRLLAALPLDEAVKMEWTISLQFWSHTPFDDSIRRHYESVNWASFGLGVEDLRLAMSAGEVPGNIDPEAVMKGLVALVTGLGVSAVYNPEAYPPAQQRHLLEQALLPLRRG